MIGGSSFLHFLLSAFSVYRIAHMVTDEEGPFSVFGHLQTWAEKQDTWIKRGLICPLCIGFWLALVPALLFPIDGVPWPLAWLGIAGLQCLLQQVSG